MVTPDGPENHPVFSEELSAAPTTAPGPTTAELIEAIKALAATIPTPDQVRQAAQAAAEQAAQRIVDDRVRTAEADQAKAIQDFQRRAAEVQREQLNGNGAHPPNTNTPSSAPATTDKVSTAISIGSAILKMLTDSMVPMTETFLNLQMKREQIKLLQTSPIALAQQMMMLNPQQASFVGMMLAPDTLRQMYPNMVSSAVDATVQAMRAGMLRSGWQPPGNLQGSPASGNWVILPDGRKVFDPAAPTPTQGGGLAAPNPFGSPLITPSQVPGFGLPSPQPNSPAPTPSAGAVTSTPPSVNPLTPTPESNAPQPNPPSQSPSQPAVKMAQGNILLGLKW